MSSPEELRAEYEAIASGVLRPVEGEQANPGVPITTARLLRDAIEPIATICWWSREANEAALDLGLSFFERYVRGRAAPLATSNASVVISCFGTFEPEAIFSILAHRNRDVSDEQILEARERGAAAGLRAATDGLDVTAAEWAGARLLEAMKEVESTARPLFGALRSLPMPADPYGRLWRTAELYREHRGDGNLAASVAAGLDPVEMNVLTELWLGYALGEYSATRGFSSDRIAGAADGFRRRGWMNGDALTGAGRIARDEIERATDDSQRSVIAQLAGDEREIVEALSLIGSAVVAAGAAPSDARKRAGG